MRDVAEGVAVRDRRPDGVAVAAELIDGFVEDVGGVTAGLERDG